MIRIVSRCKTVENRWSVYFGVDDVRAVCQELMEGKAKIDYEAGIESHGVEESGIRNLDGCDRIL